VGAFMDKDDESGNVYRGKAARSAKLGRQGERTEPAVIDHIAQELLSRPDLRSAQLYREMLGDEQWRALLPNQRAFRGHVAAARERLDRGIWSLPAADDEEVRLVLRVLGDVRERIAAGEGSLHWVGRVAPKTHQHIRITVTGAAGGLPISPRQAHWMARLRRWIPRLPPVLLFVMAAQYADRVARAAPTDDLDELMAQYATQDWDEFGGARP
jgi:hypothetical protein